MSGDRPERRKKRLRDVDSAEIAFRLKALTWSLIVAALALLIGGYVGGRTSQPALVAIAFGLGGFAVSYFGSLALGAGAGRIAGSLYFSSGSSTRSRREYSLAESLIVRGRIAEAVTELENACAQYADDAEPALRLARLLRDRTDRPDAAVRWFRTAIDRCGDDAGTQIGALREIIELYTHVLRTPRRALPDLARLASHHADSAAGVWARREIAEIKQSMQKEDEP